MTFSMRASFIFLLEYIGIPEKLKPVLAMIPAAVFPALIGPAVVFHQGSVEFLLGKERLVVCIFSTLLCYKVRSVFVTLIFGMSMLFILLYVA